MVNLGANWELIHVTDRVIELRKDDPVYRRFTGRDGFVRVRAQPGMDRAALIHQARELAQRNDEALALRLAKRMEIPSAKLAAFQGKTLGLSRAFATPEDPERIGVKRG